VGVCHQKVSEAEVIVYSGVRHVFVSNKIVGSAKIARLVVLEKQARIAVRVGHTENVAALNEAAIAFTVRLSVLVELNIGNDWCGTEPGDPARLQVGDKIYASPGTL
jgi:D-serine deaminase-like pyridoxal phosphate-dependent protein